MLRPAWPLAIARLASFASAAIVAVLTTSAAASDAADPVAPITLAQTARPATPSAIVPRPAATERPAVASEVAEPDRVQGDGKRTRFVIGLDRQVQFQVFSLSSPNRVIVELPDVDMQLPAQPHTPVGLVSSFRGGLSAPGRNRIVIEVKEPVIVESAKLEKAAGKGHRLALDIVPVDDGKQLPKARKPLAQAPSALGAGMLQPPAPRPALSPKERAARTFKPTIVIDPGHGGHDSGAQRYGTVEKDVVLAFSLALRDKLVKTGRYNVLMTRESDVFVDLDERRDFGEKHKAALFIAVHADYASTNARGATIYSLRESMANDLKRSAKGDVASRVLSSNELAALRKGDGERDADTVKSILSDLAQREVDATKDRTNAFSRTVIEHLGSATSLRDDPDKQANFRVLKSAQVPSVLIELAYVSNAEDAKLLKSNAWRDKVSDTIVGAVENYFSNQIARLPM